MIFPPLSLLNLSFKVRMHLDIFDRFTNFILWWEEDFHLYVFLLALEKRVWAAGSECVWFPAKNYNYV